MNITKKKQVIIVLLLPVSVPFSPCCCPTAVHTHMLFIQKKMNCARLLQPKGCSPMVCVLTLITDGLSQ